MIDHMSLRVSDFERACRFYSAALGPLGYSLAMEYPGYAGFAASGQTDFWVTTTSRAVNPTHVAFVGDRAAVDAFYEVALAAGGRDAGAPGPRVIYHPTYYAAFVLDPDDNVIEVMTREPEEQPGAAKGRKPARPKKPAAPQRKPAAPRPKKTVAGAQGAKATPGWAGGSKAGGAAPAGSGTGRGKAPGARKPRRG